MVEPKEAFSATIKTLKQAFDDLSVEDKKKKLRSQTPTSNLKRPSSEEIRRQDLHNQEVRQQDLINSNLALSIKLKEDIFRWVQNVVSLYLICVLGIVLYSMYGGIEYNKVIISEKVMIALLTTTTVNILGLPYLIIKALFKEHEPQRKGSK